MDHEIRILISNDNAIDNMSEDDIRELATFDRDWIPDDVENLFADFCPGFESIRQRFLDDNPSIMSWLAQREVEMNIKYMSGVADGDWDAYEDAMSLMCIDFIKRNPLFRNYYLGIGYYDEEKNLIFEEIL